MKLAILLTLSLHPPIQNNDVVTKFFNAISTGDVAFVLEHCRDSKGYLSKNGFTPLMYSTQLDKVEISRSLIHCGHDVNEAPNLLPTPLYFAAENGNRELVELLLTKGANPNMPGGDAPLIVAAETGHLAIVKVLVEKGANVNQFISGPVENIRNALYLAKKNGHRQIVRFLKENGAN